MPTQPTTLPASRPLFIALLAILVWAPLPHGGERFWEIGHIAAASFLLLTIWSFQQWRNKSPLPAIVIKNRLPLILLVAWLLYVLLQAAPLSFGWLDSLSPQSSELKAFAQFGESAPSPSLSIDPGSTLIEFIKYASYITLFFLTLVLINTRQRLKTVALTLFVTGFVLSLYSLFNHYTYGSMSLNESIPPWINHWNKVTRGTFSHKNHFAGFLEMTIPLGIGLLMARFDPSSEKQGLRQKSMASIEFIMSSRMIYLLAISLMMITLYLTASRGGNGAFYAAFFLVSMLFIVTRRNRSGTPWIFLSLIAILFFSALLSGVGGLSDRLEKQGLGPNGRDLMKTAVYEINNEFPLFGSGAGTYPYYQYRHKAPGLGLTTMSKRAHNDYLETWTDQGAIGLLLLGSALSICLFHIFAGIRKRRDKRMRGLLFGSLFGITALLIHSIAEFNFRIPANAIYFWVLVAIGLLSASLRASTSRRN